MLNKRKTPFPVDLWDLDNRSRDVVKRELNLWLEHFVAQADGMKGNVYRANFLTDDFFYFTDCRDFVSKEVEGKGVENSLKVRSRKRKVMLQLFVRFLLGEKFQRKYKCTHCGYEAPDTLIYGFKDGGGHFTFCPKCGKTDICTYPGFYDTCMENLKAKLLAAKLIAKNCHPGCQCDLCREIVEPSKGAEEECKKHGIKVE